MKYWLYYIICEGGWGSSLQNELYAFTSDKHIAKKFEQERNMNVFHKKVVKLDKDDVKALIKTYRTCELNIHSIVTINHKLEKTELKMALTESEHHVTYALVENTYVELATHTWCNYEMFQDDVIDILKDIGYVTGYEYSHYPFDLDYRTDYTSLRTIFFVDEFHMLMAQYGTLFIDLLGGVDEN